MIRGLVYSNQIQGKKKPGLLPGELNREVYVYRDVKNQSGSGRSYMMDRRKVPTLCLNVRNAKNAWINLRLFLFKFFF